MKASNAVSQMLSYIYHCGMLYVQNYYQNPSDMIHSSIQLNYMNH